MIQLKAILIVCLSALSFGFTTQSTAQSQDPTMILEQSKAAIREISGFSAQFRVYGEGGSMFADTLPSINGRFIMGELDDLGQVIHIVGESKDQQSSPSESIDLLFTKDKFLWTDHTNQTINEASRTGKTKKLPSAFNLIFFDSFLADEPFANDTKDAKSITLGDQAEIAGTLCDTVVIKRADQKGGTTNGNNSYTDVVWYIGTKDKLPRKVDRITDAGMIKITLVLELSNMRLSQPPKAQLDIARPVGYEFKSHIRKPRTTTRTNTPTPKVTKKPQTTTPATPKVRRMPSFSFTTVDGQTIDNTTQAGRTSLYYFWGSWCTPCNASTPMVSDLSREFEAQNLDTFGLAIREMDPDATQSQFASAGHQHRLVMQGESTATALRVRVYPTIVIVDNEGVIVFQEGVSKTVSSTKLVENAKNKLQELFN